MKLFAVLAALVVAASAAAANTTEILPLIAKLPACGITCISNAVPSVCGKNGILDYGCQCANVKKLTPLITPCVVKTCDGQKEQLEVAQLTQQICAVYYKDNAAAFFTQAAKTQSSIAAALSAGKTPAAGPTSYTPAGNSAPLATAVPMVGAALGALAFAL